MDQERTAENWRFDDIVRSERYFTATLLPAILFHDFHDSGSGLNAFLDLVRSKALTRGRQPTERDSPGNAVPREDRRPTWSAETAEIITEFHIARDLRFARMLARADAVPPADGETEPERRDAPDLVIVLDDELIVCEGKFFDARYLATLNDQLRSQRHQIRYLFEARPSLRAYRHVTILPVEGRPHPDCDAVLTWGEIAELAATVLGPTHYVTARLRAAVDRYRALDGEDGVPNYDGRLPLDLMLEKCGQPGDDVHVGYAGGEGELLRQPLAYLEQRPWKWRDPLTNPGVVVPRNWIPGTRFVELIEERRSQTESSSIDQQ